MSDTSSYADSSSRDAAPPPPPPPRPYWSAMQQAFIFDRWRSRDQQVPVIDWLQNVMDVGINSGIFHESDRNRFNLGEVYRMTEVQHNILSILLPRRKRKTDVEIPLISVDPEIEAQMNMVVKIGRRYQFRGRSLHPKPKRKARNASSDEYDKTYAGNKNSGSQSKRSRLRRKQAEAEKEKEKEKQEEAAARSEDEQLFRKDADGFIIETADEAKIRAFYAQFDSSSEQQEEEEEEEGRERERGRMEERARAGQVSKEAQAQEAEHEDEDEEEDEEDGGSEVDSRSESIVSLYHELCAELAPIEQRFLERRVWIALFHLSADSATLSVSAFKWFKEQAALIVSSQEQENEDPLADRYFRSTFLKWMKLSSFLSHSKRLVWDKRTRTLFHLSRSWQNRFFLTPYTSKQEQIAELHRIHAEKHSDSSSSSPPSPSSTNPSDIGNEHVYMRKHHYPYAKEFVDDEWKLIVKKCSLGCNKIEAKQEDAGAAGGGGERIESQLSSSSLSLQQRLALSISPPINSRWFLCVNYLSDSKGVRGYVIAIDYGSLYCFGDLLRTTTQAEVEEWLSFSMMRIAEPLVLMIPRVLDAVRNYCRNRKILLADASGVKGSVLRISDAIRNLCQSRLERSKSWANLFTRLTLLSNNTPFHRLRWSTPFEQFYKKPLACDVVENVAKSFPEEAEFLNLARTTFFDVGALPDETAAIRPEQQSNAGSSSPVQQDVKFVIRPAPTSNSVLLKASESVLHVSGPTAYSSASLDDLL